MYLYILFCNKILLFFILYLIFLIIKDLYGVGEMEVNLSLFHLKWLCFTGLGNDGMLSQNKKRLKMY